MTQNQGPSQRPLLKSKADLYQCVNDHCITNDIINLVIIINNDKETYHEVFLNFVLLWINFFLFLKN